MMFAWMCLHDSLQALTVFRAVHVCVLQVDVALYCAAHAKDCIFLHAGRGPAMRLPCWWQSLAFLINSLQIWQQLWSSHQQS